MSVRELRADLADVINAASTRGQVTFVTSRGRRVAGVVSVAAAEQAAAVGDQADGDAGTAVMFAVNLAMMLDRGGTPSLTRPSASSSTPATWCASSAATWSGRWPPRGR